ncbi:LysR family transcriptional regulator [Microbacterium sp. SORGH_AS_0888]|uniref:LysR family transcriptional regulator n=1 Tax=Microbacterium sp. SORGH_AS_0888 TaxID=3041791 RepID=UPI002781D7BF|nr:LysR family transcriptional regulator [Microbacterium sp. SORGH_AS_0888]MDQ1129632.1 LysR family nod box-dependent transcriptional activator [Microbacterium sp. SORGH_AS_0888]
MSDEPPLSRLDLNLLVALDALLTERNVTRAAARLRLSQPALSSALARLRTHFDDPLLVRRGNQYDLTPLAVRLAELSVSALEGARRVFDSRASWEASSSSREFVVYGSDYALATAAPAISRAAKAEAPGVRLRFVLSSVAFIEDVAQRLVSADGLLMPHGVVAPMPHVDLFSDDWVVLAAADSPLPEGALTMQTLAERPWAFTYQSRQAFTSAGRQLEQLGVDPVVETVVESFVNLPMFIEHTDRLALVQRRLARRVCRLGDVRVHELPFAATPILNALWWHPVHDADPEHRWLRQLAVAAVGDQRFR